MQSGIICSQMTIRIKHKEFVMALREGRNTLQLRTF
jgi:hypothetical protein